MEKDKESKITIMQKVLCCVKEFQKWNQPNKQTNQEDEKNKRKRLRTQMTENLKPVFSLVQMKREDEKKTELPTTRRYKIKV